MTSGRFTIAVVGKGSFTADADTPLLEAGRQAGFGFVHACRNGNCLRCAGRLLAGQVEQRQGQSGPVQRIQAGLAGADQVLYCVARPRSDCLIQAEGVTAPGELAMHEVTAQILGLEKLNHDVWQVRLRLPAGRRIRWHAGQYLLLHAGEQPSAFSIANACQGRDLQLHMRVAPDHGRSESVLAALQERPTVRVTLPLGQRCLGETLPSRPQTFICGSTGYAQARAMIEDLLARNAAVPLRLYWGARRLEDFYQLDEARQWAASGRLELVLALSEQTAPGFLSGLIHHSVLSDLPCAGPDTDYHVAGSPAMVWAVFDALVAAGVPSDRIQSDVFDYAPRPDGD